MSNPFRQRIPELQAERQSNLNRLTQCESGQSDAGVTPATIENLRQAIEILDRMIAYAEYGINPQIAVLEFTIAQLETNINQAEASLRKQREQLWLTQVKLAQLRRPNITSQSE
jgi:hypothetical protein